MKIEDDNQANQFINQLKKLDINALYKEFKENLGGFIQPYFIICLFKMDVPSHIKPIKSGKYSTKDVLTAILNAGLFPVLVHEFSHYLQSISTPNGHGQLLRFYNLCEVSREIMDLSYRLYAEGSLTTTRFSLPSIEWLRKNFSSQGRLITQHDNLIEGVLLHRGYFVKSLTSRIEKLESKKLPLTNCNWLDPIVRYFYTVDHYIPSVKGTTKVHRLGSFHIREGMAKAIECVVITEFNTEKARDLFLEKTFNFFSTPQNPEVEVSEKLYSYYVLFYIFVYELYRAKAFQHITIECFIALCEISLIVHAPDKSSVVSFIWLLDNLVNYKNEIEPISYNNQEKFVNQILNFSTYPKLQDIIKASLYRLDNSLLLKAQKYELLKRLIFKVQPNLRKFYIFRLKNFQQNKPLLFLDFLDSRTMIKLIGRCLNNLFLVFRNGSLHCFRNIETDLNYMILISISNFFLSSLHFNSTTCFFQQHANWGICRQYISNGNVCNSLWPRENWSSTHKCAYIQHLNNLPKELNF